MSQMQRVTVELAARPYDIWIAPGLLDRLDEFIAPLAPHATSKCVPVS